LEEFSLALRECLWYQRRIGFIALFGVAVLNGLVLIAEFNSIRMGETDLKTIVLKETRFVCDLF
jgi:Cu/Ag efflux pump CusA